MPIVSSGPNTATRSFLRAQIETLEPFEYVAIGARDAPLSPLEVTRGDGPGYEVRVPPRHPATPLPIPKRSRLVELGFRNDDAEDPLSPWVQPVPDVDAAIDLVQATLAEIVEVELGDAVNVVHGSRQAEHEAEQRLVELRAEVEQMLHDIIGHSPLRDPEGDYVLSVNGIDVIVAPRVIPNAMSLVRVFAITNQGLAIGPELGLVLARLNFGMTFGRFVLDAEHQAVWFDETLLGESVTEEQLRFTVGIVAATAAEWDGRLKQMFGGMTMEDGSREAGRPTGPKPGTGGYL